MNQSNEDYAVYSQYPYRFIQAFTRLELAQEFIRQHPEIALPIIVRTR